MAKCAVIAAEGDDAVLGYAHYLCLKSAVLVSVSVQPRAAVKMLMIAADNFLRRVLHLFIIYIEAFKNIVQQGVAVVFLAGDVFQRNGVWGIAEENLLIDIDAGADIYSFAQDQFARLVEGGALAKLGK